MKHPLTLFTTLLLAPLGTLHAADKPAPLPDNPLPTAKAVWRMTGDEAAAKQPFALKAEGPVKFEPLSPEEAAESRKRGGADSAATLTAKSCLSLDPEKPMQLRPAGDAITLYTRVHFDSNAERTAFYSDFLTLAVHRSGLAIAILGVKTPQGRVYRELPLAMIDRGGWLDLALRVGDGRVEFFCNGQLKCTIPLGQSLAPLFKKNQSMTIGAMRGFGNEPMLSEGKLERGVGIMKTATVAMWDRALSDGEIAFLSGVTQLETAGKKTPFDQALLDYNAFFDASLAKDVAACGKLSRSLMEFAARDPERPIYHLSQPLGWILDPAGAFFYEGRYHVFSYRYIYSFLRYNSLDHYVSDDLLSWTQWPIGPWADSPDDQFGIWLNNHFLDDDGVPNAIYCAFDGKNAWNDKGILARSRDGMVSFSEKQVILPKAHDGHIWKEGDTWYYLTCYKSPGDRPADLGSGFSIFTSPDLKNWTNRGEIFAHRKTEKNPSGFGEFPYLLSFGDKDVFMVGGRPLRYWVGRLDRQNFKFIPDHAEGIPIDVEIFNPLTVDNKGPGGSPRRIIMGYLPPNGQGEGLLPWNGLHYMPRKLEFDGQRLRQEPLPEFESLRGERETQRDVTIKAGTTGHIRTRGDAVEINAEFEPGDAKRFGLKLRVSNDSARFVRVWFDTATGDFGVDGRVSHESLPSHLAKGQPVRMRVFVDKAVVETFVNGQALISLAGPKDGKTLRYFPSVNTYIDPTTTKTVLGDGLDLFSEGGTARCTRLDVWKMNRAEPK
jgi:sucrose-6-phosphate hydrolase SacC (GH32 family)